MRNSCGVKSLSGVLLGIVLAGCLSPIAAGMLVCIGEGPQSDCCPEPKGARPLGFAHVPQFLDGTDCDCCIALDAIPSSAGVTSDTASSDVAAGPAQLQHVLPCGARIPRTASVGDVRLSSLRTVVLLI
jgi:hypothetical protein